MKFFHSTIFACAVAATAAGAVSASARGETLSAAIQAAIATHPAVSAAQAAMDASGQTVREQRSAYYPELAASAMGGRLYADNSTSRGLNVTRGAGYSGLWEGTASLTQRVYDWGETGNKVDAARAREAAAFSGFASMQESVGLRAALAYIALLRSEAMKQSAGANLGAMEGYRKKIKVQVEEGGADEAELNRANDFLLLARNAATQFEGDYQQALADYVEATGAAPRSALERPSAPAGFPATVDDAIASAHAAHPQVLAAKAAVLAADHDIRAESTSYLPKISTQLSYLERDQRDVIGGEAKDARAVMKMDWAYSLGGAQHARENRAEALKAQARAQLEETLRRVERDVRVAWSALDIVRRQHRTQDERKAATASVVQTYKTQYEGGKRGLVELMQAESQSFDASVAYGHADYGILNASYTLMAAMGQLVGGLETATTRTATQAATDDHEAANP